MLGGCDNCDALELGLGEFNLLQTRRLNFLFLKKNVEDIRSDCGYIHQHKLSCAGLDAAILPRPGSPESGNGL